MNDGTPVITKDGRRGICKGDQFTVDDGRVRILVSFDMRDEYHGWDGYVQNHDVDSLRRDHQQTLF